MAKPLPDVLAQVFGLPASAITPDLTKEAVGNWDSLKQMDLVLSLEREYAITLDLPDIVRMTSVEAITEVLNQKGITVAA